MCAGESGMERVRGIGGYFMPVAAQAEVPSLNYTHMAVTYTKQADVKLPAQPR
jgi:hypothetical protein